MIDNPESLPAALPSNQKSVPTRKRGPWVIGFLLLAATGLGFYLLRRAPQKSASAENSEEVPVATIKVATAHRGNMGSYIEALGTVTPLATVNLYSQITGVVVSVHYAEGQIVHRGDPLIDIDSRPYEAQLQEAQGTLERDEALLKQAEIDLARYEKASAQHAIAKQAYDTQQSLVEQYRGTIKNDTGQVQYAQVQLGYCHLTSPIDGRVGLRLVDPGNTVFSGGSNPLVVVMQLRPISVVFNVAEDNLGQVRDQILNHTALPIDAFDRTQQVKLATGTLLTLDNQIDTSTGTVRFRGQFENSDLRLFPNQFVNVRLLVKTMTNAVLVPSGAVQRNGTQAFVYVVTGDTVKIHPIQELATEGDVSAVDGLNPGEVVPITGFNKLQDGGKITIEDQPASGQGAAPPATTGKPSGEPR